MELTASKITQDALLILRARNIECWRQTNNTGKRWRNNVNPGVPDIIGYNKGTGLAIYCEIKTSGDRLSEHQITFFLKAMAANCICLIATEVKGRTELIDFKVYYRDLKI